MAESATGKTSTNNWWKSLTVRKKPKEISVYTSESSEDRSWGIGGGSLSSSPGSRENQHPNSMSGGATELNNDAKSDKSANTGRRNLKISRSGRFKEKRKVRATLPESTKFFQENPSSHSNDERQ
ncbi:proline-rich protein 15 [Hyla sarda]|uniref:proline-rich protein 15 n=1 Tax=Hyla sarda TaxID=327740 RepID=UPI0024C241C2|nr:proline-rich protein 15 [Hyla sarda]